MRLVRRFAALAPAERRLVVRALLTVLTVRLGMALGLFGALRGRLARVGPVPGGWGGVPPERIAWAVRAVARRVPGTTCLVQALAAAALLRRHGMDADVRIGVTRGDRGALEAHAWVESGGRVVLGGTERAFVPLVGSLRVL